MAQTKKKRKKKQRGTQAGSIDTRKKARPRNRAEAKSQAKSGGRSGGTKADTPPTWKSAAIRGIIAAAVFMVLLMVVFGRTFTEAAPIGAFMLVFYIPAGYYMDQMMWRRRERAKIRAGGKK
ncbi:MAG: hypothetical protein JJE10_10305 [Thermoleophilia bacterium]|nr:hypothetical protein [Thermoleophilia bacterium]